LNGTSGARRRIQPSVVPPSGKRALGAGERRRRAAQASGRRRDQAAITATMISTKRALASGSTTEGASSRSSMPLAARGVDRRAFQTPEMSPRQPTDGPLDDPDRSIHRRSDRHAFQMAALGRGPPSDGSLDDPRAAPASGAGAD